MTPQSNFMVLAAILPDRLDELGRLLDAMNHAPGWVDPDNELVPFGRFDRLHFARFIILDDRTTEDVRVYGLEPRDYPLYLAFLGDIDGDELSFLGELVGGAADGLRAVFSCCEGFDEDTDLLHWMRDHRSPPVANYVNTRGRTVTQVRQEAALAELLRSHVAAGQNAYLDRPPRETHAILRAFVAAEIARGRLRLSRPEKTPLGWWLRNMTHKLGMPLLLLLVSPLLLLLALPYIVVLRSKEKSDPVVAPTADQAHSDELSATEDHDVTNQFTAMGSLKPGLFRLVTIYGVLLTVDWAARHLTWPGRLGRIRSIHFARWVFIAGRERMAFFSNYDGSVETYMDDFINKTGFGLNAAFSNGIGYPTTNWLILDGSADERRYKEYLRRHTIVTQVWYKAYPCLTAIDLDRNSRIRKGIEARRLSDKEARRWAALL